jgi:hypothetical protein
MSLSCGNLLQHIVSTATFSNSTVIFAEIFLFALEMVDTRLEKDLIARPFLQIICMLHSSMFVVHNFLPLFDVPPFHYIHCLRLRRRLLSHEIFTKSLISYFLIYTL